MPDATTPPIDTQTPLTAGERAAIESILATVEPEARAAVDMKLALSPWCSLVLVNRGDLFVQAAAHGLLDALRTLRARFLVDGDESAASRGSITALSLAVGLNEPECVAELLALGANPHRRVSGKTPLIIAAEEGRTAIAQMLLPSSDANAANSNGQTALMRAASRGHLDIVRLLLPASDARAVDQEGASALHLAARYGRPEVVSELLPHSDPQQQSQAGKTAFETALSGALTGATTGPALWACVDLLSATAPRARVEWVISRVGSFRFPRWTAQMEQRDLSLSVFDHPAQPTGVDKPSPDESAVPRPPRRV